MARLRLKAPRSGRTSEVDTSQKRAAGRRRQVPLALGPAVSRCRAQRRTAHQAPGNVRRESDLPTLLVRGGLSDLLSEQGAQAFLTLCPTAEYVSVTGAAHMVAGDRNDIFANAVIEFHPEHGEPRDQ